MAEENRQIVKEVDKNKVNDKDINERRHEVSKLKDQSCNVEKQGNQRQK